MITITMTKTMWRDRRTVDSVRQAYVEQVAQQIVDEMAMWEIGGFAQANQWQKNTATEIVLPSQSHQPMKLRLTLQDEWEWHVSPVFPRYQPVNGGTYTITPGEVGMNVVPTKIKMTADKSPQVIAREIERRLLSLYQPFWDKAMAFIDETQEAAKSAREQADLFVTIGRGVVHPPHIWRDPPNVEIRIEKSGHRGIYGDIRNITEESCEVHLQYVPHCLAEKIVAVLARYAGDTTTQPKESS